jgi:ABC-type polysaccharide/polyol phosphate transport system ATPase subunit
MVSHDMASIREFCTRAVWLRRGVLVGDGPVETIVSRYEAVMEQEALSGGAAQRGDARAS